MGPLFAHTSEPLLAGVIVAMVTGLAFPVYARCGLGPVLSGVLSFLSGIAAVTAFSIGARLAEWREARRDRTDRQTRAPRAGNGPPPLGDTRSEDR